MMNKSVWACGVHGLILSCMSKGEFALGCKALRACNLFCYHNKPERISTNRFDCVEQILGQEAGF
jgi:hypothetical protein